MSSSNLDNNTNRDGPDAPQNLSPYFDNIRFNVVDPTLSIFDGQGDTSQLSHYQSNNVIGQGLALPAAQDQFIHNSQQSAFEHEWNSHILSNDQNDYGPNFFSNPYHEQHTHGPPPTSDYNQGEAFEDANTDVYRAGVGNYPQAYQSYSPVSKSEHELVVTPWTLHTGQQGFTQDLMADTGNEPLQQLSRTRAADSTLHSPIPSGEMSGNFLITTSEDLDKWVHSKPLSHFVHIGLDPQETSITKTALPTYVARKSRNEIMSLLKSDNNLKSKINKKLGRTGEDSPRKVRARIPGAPSSKASTTIKKVAEEDGLEEDESSSDESEEELIQPPIPAVRPSNPTEGVSYDAIKALWCVPYRSATRDDIQKGLSDFWKIIGTIRNRWKSDAAAVQVAEAAKNVNDLPLLKERVSIQRQMLEVALKAALKHGHKDLLEHLGRHSPLMASMAAALQDRAKDADYSGELTKSILEILLRCATMIEEETLSKTSLVKIVQRFSKRGDDNTKDLAEKIIRNITASSRKESSSKSASKTELQAKDTHKDIFKGDRLETARIVKEESDLSGKEPAEDSRKSSSATRASAPLSTGVKRPRNSDGRVATSSKKRALASTYEQTAASSKQNSAPTNSKPQNSPPNVKKVVPKPPNYFSSLQPTYKKSATATTPANTSTTESKELGTKVEKTATPPAASKSAAQSASSFSFAATMANLKRPKEIDPQPKKVESAPPETAEEKAIRLRKEKRRSMRVSFKPEAELTEIRYFEHDPEEELGHNANQVRDVGDLESEGRMFKLKQQAKQLHQSDPDRVDVDDEDDEEEEEEDDAEDPMKREYPLPSEIDFSEIPDGTKDINYIPFGGGKAHPDSPDSLEQTRREEETLVVVYPGTSDIPPSPKEPPELAEENTSPQEFGVVSKEEHKWFANRLSNLQANDQMKQPSAPVDLSAIFESFGQAPIANSQQAQQTPSATDIEEIIKHLKKSTGHQEQQLQQDHLQPYQPNPFQPSPDPQQFQTHPAMQMFPQPTQANLYPSQQSVNAQAPNSADISALLASINRQYPMQPQQSQGPLLSVGESSVSQQQQYSYASDERGRYGGNYGNNDGQHQQRPWQNKKTFDQNRPNPKYKVEPCKFFPKGQCTKGADCTYRHDMA